MKRTISTMICLAAMALAFTACDDETEYKLADTPSVTLSPTSVTLSSEAVESYTINYTVANAASGATVSATADASWISGIDYSVSGQIRFSVAENTSDEMRTGTLTLTYSYDDGTVTAKAAVVQYGAGDPVLSVDPNAIVAGEEGGTYSFGYSVENSAEGESVSCTADADWISGFDYSEWGKVSFDVEANSGELRSATITVTYAGLTKEVDVVQDRLGTVSNTMFRIDVSSVGASYEGDECSFPYSVKNPINGESVSCSADVDWITDFADDGEGTVTFKVAEHSGDLPRTATVTATYHGIEAEVPVSQGIPLSKLIGTYAAAGTNYDGPSEWTLRICESEDEDEVIIDGLVPEVEDYYVGEGTDAYIARANLNIAGQIIIPSQMTGYYTRSGITTYYIGWTPCTQHTTSWYYDASWPDCTLTCDPATGTWTSDYGEFLGLFSASSLERASLSSFYDVTEPEFTITKVDEDPYYGVESSVSPTSVNQSSASNAARPLDTLVPYLNFMVK